MTMSAISGARPGGAVWPDLDLSVRAPADGRVLVAAAVGGVAVDLALRAGVVGVAGSLAVAVAALALASTGRLANRQAASLVGAAVVFGAFLSIRMSPWLVAPDVLAAAGLLVLAASFSGGGSVLDLTIPAAFTRAATAALHGLAAPSFAFVPLRRRMRATGRHHVGPVVRGVVLAVPVLLVLGALLSSADPLFGSLFHLPPSPATLLVHAVLIGVGAWGTAGLVRAASAVTPDSAAGLLADTSAPPRLGAVESITILSGLVVLFGAFAVTQAVAAAGGGRHVLATRHLTYATYARSGFFQLLASAGLTLAVLLALRACAELGSTRARRTFTGLGVAASGLTLVVAVAALHRLALYEQAYGLTMLRLWSQAAAVWIGLLFVLLALAMLGVGRHGRWFVSAGVGAGLAMLLALNLLNPEAVVVRRNVARAAHGHRVDPAYLTALSDDAVPALVAAVPKLPEAERQQVEGFLSLVACGGDGGRRFTGWAAANLDRHRAAAVRAGAASCP